MTVTLQTDEINGPHVVLEDEGQYFARETTLRVRHFYAGSGKIVLQIRERRRSMEVIIDAADLIEAVSKLMPSAVHRETV